ncbi:MAG: VOC family protein [Anaerolineales bacterium]|nr:VOC family protein [Anaerolineales bacterium]
MRIDHVVIHVPSLERAVERYAGLGFTVALGGEHPAFGSRNALIPFEDGSYLELVTFVEERPLDGGAAQRRFRAWRTRQGLADWVLSADDLAQTVARLGAGWSAPERGHRLRPDGQTVAWEVAFPDRHELPFLISDLTPRDLRVLPGDARRHANGARGIARLTVAVPALDDALPRYAALLGHAGTPCDRPLPGSVARCWRLGGATLDVVEARPAASPHAAGPIALALWGNEGAMIEVAA